MAKSCEQLRSELRILKNPHAPPSEKKDREIDAVEQQLKNQNCAAQTDLTGYWSADDGGFYYLRQDGEIVWWVGLSNDPDPAVNSGFGLQNGLTFSNVFRGQRIDNTTIEGMWSDVPRGVTTNYGRLSLEITTADNGLTPQLRKTDFSGGFGASLWTRGGSDGLPKDRGIQDVFNHVIKGSGGNNPLAGDLETIFKDSAVVFGSVTSPAHVAWVSLSNGPQYARTYQNFICFDGDQASFDGDLLFDMNVDIDQLVSPFRQINFWTNGWLSDPVSLQTKMQYTPGAPLHLHLEQTMFGRTAGCGDSQHYSDAPLLPGWQEQNGNSVLLNGRPINGMVDIGEQPVDKTREVIAILHKEIPLGAGIRVTGCLVLDCGHFRKGDWFDDCGPYEADFQNQEIHPVYAIDIIDATPQTNLSGVWSDADGRTYYVRQLDDNTVWWLGMSPFRDHTFARVFHGDLESQTITGQWVDMPLGQGQSAGSLTMKIDPGKMALLANSSDSGIEQQWIKLYDSFPPSTIMRNPSVTIVGDESITVSDLELKHSHHVAGGIYRAVILDIQNPRFDWGGPGTTGTPASRFAQFTAIGFDMRFVRVGETRLEEVEVLVNGDNLLQPLRSALKVQITVTHEDPSQGNGNPHGGGNN